MQGALNQVQELLESGDYNNAWKQLKKLINELAGSSEEGELKKAVRRYKFMLNLSRDINLTNIFCNRVMRKWEELAWGDEEYVEQCRLLNRYIDKISNDRKQVIREMHEMHPLTAQHIIISVFEHFHQQLVHTSPDDFERLLYLHFTFGLETNYESSISALSAMLRDWKEDVRIGRFKGKEVKVYHFEDEIIVEFSQKLMPIIRSIHFLDWIANEVSQHTTTMEVTDSEVKLFYRDFQEYRKYMLPMFRDQTRKQNTQRKLHLLVAERFSWSKRELDYEKVIKDSGDRHFSLKIDDVEFFEAYKYIAEISYQSYLKIKIEMYIMNFDELKCRGFNVLALYFFYYSLMAVAFIYFMATRHYEDTREKLPLFPYLRISKNDIGKMLIPVLAMITKQEFSQKDIDNLLAFYEFGSDKLFDMYLKPVIIFGDEVVLVPSLFMMNDFPRTFLHLLNKLNVNFEERGDTYEVCMRERFMQNGFMVFTDKFPYNYNYEGNMQSGDIDIIARLGNYLFVGEAKNKFEPLDSKGQINVDRTIRKAVKQAKNFVKYIERNPQEFSQRFGISTEELTTLTIQPFVLVNCFYGSGQVIDNIPIVDTSTIEKYFDGEIRVYYGDKVITSHLIRSEGPIRPQEFRDNLYSPYFIDHDVYNFSLQSRHVEIIDDKKFMIGPENDHDHFPSKYLLSEAIAHIQEISE
ncbi:hypothetical protein [Paenibacillus terrae]|nr:hypothetical protein [Paenibacillus terrae]